MIKYSLICTRNHQFSSWFQSAAAFDKLVNAGLLSCSICGTLEVKKAMMTPQIKTNYKDKTQLLADSNSAIKQDLVKLRRKIEAHADDVGINFAREARKINCGEAPKRNIYGKAAIDDVKSLIEDEIPVIFLPLGRKYND